VRAEENEKEIERAGTICFRFFIVHFIQEWQFYEAFIVKYNKPCYNKKA
jgi:hypothetical protein